MKVMSLARKYRRRRVKEKADSNKEESPEKESEELADEHGNGAIEWFGVVEPEGNGKHVPYYWNPAQQTEPNTIFVNVMFLLLKGFTLDLEILLHPLPFAEPAYPVC